MRKAITRKWLERNRACRGQVDTFSALFPEGMPLTRENVATCHKANLDIVWAACHLMAKTQRRDFIIFTLKQRQPHIVDLFKQVGLHDHAEKIKALTFDDQNDQTEARHIFAAAWAAAWAVASAAAWAVDSAAAWAAARDAAWAVVASAAAWAVDGDAAWAVAGDAAWAVASAAAWAAARAAGWYAAREAATDKQVEYCINVLLPKKERRQATKSKKGGDS